MTRKRTMNQDQSTLTLIPRKWKRVIDPPPNMAPWEAASVWAVPDEADWLRKRLEELERIERPSASDGERRAAEWLVAQFAELGAEARIEAESAHGTYWWPLGLGAVLGTLGSLLSLRSRRLLGGLL